MDIPETTAERVAPGDRRDVKESALVMLSVLFEREMIFV